MMITLSEKYMEYVRLTIIELSVYKGTVDSVLICNSNCALTDF